MKTIIRNSDKLSIYAQDDLVLTTTGTNGNGWYDPSHTSKNCKLLDLTLPPLWVGAVWAYISNKWVVVDTARHDLLIESAYKATIPQEVTMRQARLALSKAGLYLKVNTTIAAMTGTEGDDARIEWEFSSVVKRNQPLIMALALTLKWTSVQIDNLFIEASKIL